VTMQPNEIEQHIPRVLVVDDELDIRETLALGLKRTGFMINTAENAKVAFGMLELEQYDAVVTDVMMPEEDGIAFLARVYKVWPELPVILMTGHAHLHMAVNAIKHGAFDFVHKPFDFDYIRKIVERAVNYTKLQRMEKNYRAELEETVVRRTTELKEAMAELDLMRSALLKAANDKNNFISNISHEMRTPMNGVIGTLELLAEEGVSGIQAEYLAMARQSADEMLAMINHLLAFNKGFGTGGASLRYDLIDLAGLLNSMIAKQQEDFNLKKLALSLNIAPDVPHQIWTDREQLSRLLAILLGNAYKFTDSGGVTVDVTMQDAESDGEFIQFVVADSGIGIPEGMLERIFEPFVQGDGSFTRRHGGVGLGLSIARQIALLLNGELRAEHASGGGSRFIFRFHKVIAPK